MPKTTKRAATRRAAKIAKAHATELPKLEVKAPLHRAPKGKRPARGLARYPWAVTLVLALIIASVAALYFTHTGPFAPPKVVKHPAPTATPAVLTSSPCNASSVVKQLTNTAAPPTTAQFNKNQHTYSKAPSMSIDTKKLYCVGLNTNRGLIVLELDPKIAPNTVNNFVYLAEHHFYDGMKFHRVVPGFVVQTGDPKGDGTGGPGYTFNDEPVKGDYTAGCVAMANNGHPNTNGSQFFICTANDTSKFPKKSYNLFGHVTMGLNIAQQIQGPEGSGDPDYATRKNIKPDTLNYVTVVAVNPS
jgi:cyclophilin family peptidyl-prolyl cis-trans isomerase